MWLLARNAAKNSFTAHANAASAVQKWAQPSSAAAVTVEGLLIGLRYNNNFVVWVGLKAFKNNH